MEPLIQTLEYHGEGYKPLMAFETWRVAVLNYTPELHPDQLNKMQRHNLTDEAFVLLSGRCILFVAGGSQGVEGIQAVDMRPGKVYNIRKGVWHSHTLTQGGAVLVIENDNTSTQNSTVAPLTPAQTAELVALTKNIWK